MSEHYTKATVEVREWCRVCGHATMHRVDSGRLGACKDCLKKREQEAAVRGTTGTIPQQGDLFR